MIRTEKQELVTDEQAVEEWLRSVLEELLRANHSALAKKTGIGRSTMWRYLEGDNVSLQRFLRLLDGLGFTIVKESSIDQMSRTRRTLQHGSEKEGSLKTVLRNPDNLPVVVLSTDETVATGVTRVATNEFFLQSGQSELGFCQEHPFISRNTLRSLRNFGSSHITFATMLFRALGYATIIPDFGPDIEYLCKPAKCTEYEQEMARLVAQGWSILPTAQEPTNGTLLIHAKRKVTTD